jgi:hypothetical protein
MDDLARCVTDDPPPESKGRGSWQRRFEQVIGGVDPPAGQALADAAERCGITLEWRNGDGQAYLRIKG